MRKVLYLDVETTGLNPSKCSIIQLAGIIEIDGEEKEIFNILMRPFEGSEISEEALNINGRTREEIEKFDCPIKGYNQFKDICLKYVDKFNSDDKLFLVAHNISFDFDFLVNHAQKCSDRYLGSFVSFKDHFCTFRTVQALKFMGLFPPTFNNKLNTLCAKCGIEIGEVAHNALRDVIATKKLAEKLQNILKK